MAPEAVITERVYHAVKARLLSGSFAPGVRLEVKAIAEDQGISITPVRDAIHRLVGERLLDIQAHGGFQVPMISEPLLRDLYAWNSQLALLAIGLEHAPRPNMLSAISKQTTNGASAEDIVAAAASVFDWIADRSRNREHRAAVSLANDRLHLARLAEVRLIAEARRELRHLARLVESRAHDAATGAILTYHHQRIGRVAEIVERIHSP